MSYEPQNFNRYPIWYWWGGRVFNAIPTEQTPKRDRQAKRNRKYAFKNLPRRRRTTVGSKHWLIRVKAKRAINTRTDN